MKRKGILGGIFAMALILVLALALGVGSVSAAEPTIVDSGNCGKDGSNVTWTLDSAGLLTISGTGEMADYEYNSTPWYDYKYKSEIKDAVITDGVTSIGDAAFYYCKGPISVTIPDSVTSIGDNAFAYCKGLTNVTIPDGVTSIGEYAFLGCDNIEKVHIANIAAWCGMVFGNYASNPLKYAKNLYVNDVLVTNLTIPSSVTSIGCYAFYNCTSLTGVTIPDSVKNIGIYAFAGCKGLTSVEIPDSVTSIGDYAFSDCTGLTEVYYNARAVADLTYDSSVFENAGTATDGLKAIFGESVEKIPVALFYDCKGLTSVIIGKNVTSIGDKAFYNCKGLVEISYNAKAAEYSDYFAFNNAGTAARGLKVIFGESVEKIPDGLFYDCTALTGVTIGSNVTSIGDYAFSGCKGLTGIVLPGSVTSIENYAFYNCTGLTSVTIPDSVTSIGYYAFYNCTGLKEIIYNAKAAADLTYDSEVFENAGTAADGMKVVFGESVKKIPAYLFYGANIQKIEFAGDPPVVGNGAWESNRSIYAYYPMHNSAWTNSARIACGSSLVWRGYCYEPLSSGICKINKTVYMTGDTLDDYSISMEVTHKDGCTETIFYDSGLLELGSCDMSTPGAKTIDVIYRGTTAQLKIYVHERKTQTLDKKGYPESSHNYENNLDKTYTYKAAGAVSLDVTFSAQTEVETNIDYIYVNGAQYTGTELAGKTISIQGDTLTIRLVSDKSDSAYGFSIDRIVKTYMEHQYKNGVCTLCGTKNPNFKPAAPTVKPSYVGASGKPYIYWGAVDGANRYYVYRSTTKDGTYSFLGSTANLNYTDSKADAGTTYYYKVKAGIVNGVKSNSSAAVAITCRCAKPVVKITLTQKGDPKLTWNAVTGAAKYEVYRATSKNGSYTKMFTTSNLSYTNTSAKAGTTYYYKVKAVSKVKSTANSAFSTVVSIRAR